jgi:hypothetical protein
VGKRSPKKRFAGCLDPTGHRGLPRTQHRRSGARPALLILGALVLHREAFVGVGLNSKRLVLAGGPDQEQQR